MGYSQKLSLFLLRVAMGWFMLYSGIVKILDPKWSAEGYIKGTKHFTELYEWFLEPGVLPIVNLLNEYGLTLLGISLLLGFFVRLSAPLGALLMLLYYFPALNFPYAGAGAYIVDEHIIYALVLLLLAAFNAGRAWGLDGRFR